jgi:hypothetical protein
LKHLRVHVEVDYMRSGEIAGDDLVIFRASLFERVARAIMGAKKQKASCPVHAARVGTFRFTNLGVQCRRDAPNWNAALPLRTA